MARITLINPRFDESYWGLERALPMFAKRAVLPTAGLPLLAAVTPPEHHLTIVDENVATIDFDRVAASDVVGLTGMSVQRRRMDEILRELKRRKAFCVVGGPWVSVEEGAFGDLADVVFVGEAEESWPRFLREWEAGRHGRRYEQAERTEMSTVPVPRYDLLDMRRYMFGSVQFSRGCPFQCEFCDIIVTFGRRPRMKTAAQIIAELEALRRQRMAIAFVVDDNLIGNKGAIREVLAEVAAWQRRHDYPLTLFSEASIDLADEPELMAAMTEANFTSVFIGIETPNEESLRETKKVQNLRGSRSLVEKVHAIQAAGLDVWCGLIVGFDADDEGIFARQLEFVERSRISHAMLGMLAAIPKTPLYERLRTEGRLDAAGEPVFGTNVIPAGMTRERLRAGYIDLQRRLHEPEAWFDRLDRLFLDGDFRFGLPRATHLRSRPLARWRTAAADVARAAGVFAALMARVRDPAIRRTYCRRMFQLVRRRRDPAVWMVYAIKCAIHFHHHGMAQRMAEGTGSPVNTF
ncbi:MAG: radical SAM protein [Planctomycetia bacterium]